MKKARPVASISLLVCSLFCCMTGGGCEKMKGWSSERQVADYIPRSSEGKPKAAISHTVESTHRTAFSIPVSREAPVEHLRRQDESETFYSPEIPEEKADTIQASSEGTTAFIRLYRLAEWLGKKAGGSFPSDK